MADAFSQLDLIRQIIKIPRFGLFSDVDGSISRTVPTPEQAVVSQNCRHFLLTLCQKLILVAVISGRPASKIKEMIGIEDIIYIGNHGLEQLVKGEYKLAPDAEGYPKIIKATLKELEPLLSGEGVTIEDKGVTASIHYRLCQEPESAKREIIKAINSLPQAKGLRIMEGKKVINLLPDIEVNKGTATLELIKKYQLEGGIYLGDDETDIDAFKAIHKAQSDFNFQGLAIGILSDEMPQDLSKEADLTLNGVDGVERFLSWISENA